MIRFRNRHGEFALSFSHQRTEKNTFTSAKVLRLVDDGYVPMSSGTATCHERDQFNREVGRKMSLTRALRTLARSQDWTSDDKRAAWHAYFGRLDAERDYMIISAPRITAEQISGLVDLGLTIENAR